MTWIKIDDAMWSHPKIDGLDDAAFRLHICGIMFCSQHLTDGLIRSRQVHRGLLLEHDDPESVAESLVDVGLWAVTGDHYEVVGYLDHQRSREQVEIEREKARNRARKSRRTYAARAPESAGEVTPHGPGSLESSGTSQRTFAESSLTEESRGEQRKPPPSPPPNSEPDHDTKYGGGGVDETVTRVAWLLAERAVTHRSDAIRNPAGYRTAVADRIRNQHADTIRELAAEHPELTADDVANQLETIDSGVAAMTSPAKLDPTNRPHCDACNDDRVIETVDGFRRCETCDPLGATA